MKIKISGEEIKTKRPVFLDFDFNPHGIIGTGHENEAIVQPDFYSINEFLTIHKIESIDIEDIEPDELKMLISNSFEARRKRLLGKVL